MLCAKSKPYAGTCGSKRYRVTWIRCLSRSSCHVPTNLASQGLPQGERDREEGHTTGAMAEPGTCVSAVGSVYVEVEGMMGTGDMRQGRTH